MQLPSFNGNFKYLATLWDSFDSAIHSNQSLMPVCKFLYLQASLQGLVTATINGVSFSSANYGAAMILLKEHYGDPQKIINAHMDALLNLPTTEHSLDLEFLVRLSILDRSMDEYGTLLRPLMFHKIPEAVRLSICSNVPKENWNLEHF